MKLTAWMTLAILALYLWTGSRVAAARMRHKVLAPSMDGPEAFLRAVRVQANTLEQLPAVLAPLWLCAFYLGDRWAAAGALLWCAGRLLYALAYYRDPPSRGAGFLIGAAASGLLMVGAGAGLMLN